MQRGEPVDTVASNIYGICDYCFKQKITEPIHIGQANNLNINKFERKVRIRSKTGKPHAKAAVLTAFQRLDCYL